MPLMPPPFLHLPTRRTTLLLSLSLPPTLYYLSSYRMSSSAPAPGGSPAPPPRISFPTRPYTTPHTTFPYETRDLTPQDTAPDPSFYSSPRFVTHIDDHAISLLKQYYTSVLPERGRILDLCSSWISHFPTALETRAVATARGEEEGGGLEVVGVGMNQRELAANPILKEKVVQDLNVDPIVKLDGQGEVAATVCVVSIDYLTKPLEVLASIREITETGGRVHLVISNRCFPTKCVGRWLRIGEMERLEMVGDYLHFSGWEGVEIVEVCDGRVKEGEEAVAQGEMGRLMGILGMGMGGGRVDPLWVVRARKGERESL